MAGGLIGQHSVVVIPFGSIDGFGGQQVRVGALPASWYCGAMEINE